MGEERFWRLLGAFGELARNESVALRERNLPCLSRIQETKSAILAELPDLAARLGIDGSHPRLKAAVEMILEIQHANALLIGNYLSANSAARLAAESTARRLRCLGRIYNSGPRGGVRAAYAA